MIAIKEREYVNLRAVEQKQISRNRFGSWIACCWLLGFLALGSFFIVNGVAGLVSPEQASQRFVSHKKIESIHVGDRVWANIPGSQVGTESDVNPLTWRKLTIRAEDFWADGTVDDIQIETLQPPSWIKESDAQVGHFVPMPLDLLEMGLPVDLKGEVIADDPCPPILPGPGRIVVTTVNHLNNDVRELTVEDEDGLKDKIRPTGLHKFYCEPRSEWVASQEVQPGQFIRGQKGLLKVVSNVAVPGINRVYNMTVEGEHVYYVSSLGALVHNNEGPCAAPTGPTRLTRLHDSSLSPTNLNRVRQMTTDEIVTSLRTPGAERLRIRPDGTVLQGNHRIRVLEERGFDTSTLIRDAEIIPQTPIGPLD